MSLTKLGHICEHSLCRIQNDLSVGKGDLFSVLLEMPTKRSAVGMSSADTGRSLRVLTLQSSTVLFYSEQGLSMSPWLS